MIHNFYWRLKDLTIPWSCIYGAIYKTHEVCCKTNIAGSVSDEFVLTFSPIMSNYILYFYHKTEFCRSYDHKHILQYQYWRTAGSTYHIIMYSIVCIC